MTFFNPGYSPIQVLGDKTDSSKGAALIGYEGKTVRQHLLDLSDSIDHEKGASLLGSKSPLADAIGRVVSEKLFEFVSVLDFGAIEGGVEDCTAAFNRANASGKRVWIPEGLWLIDPAVSIEIISGMHMVGAGRRKTFLLNKHDVAGSTFKRNFNPAGPNNYVEDVKISDLAVFLNHKHQASMPSSVQIGFDLRNVTRSEIHSCYAGNYRYGGAESLYPNAASKPEAMRGYGYVYGNVSGGDPAYCGGEVHRNINCKAWWLRKGIALDDSDLSPASACYNTEIISPDIQTVERGVSQESQYNTGCEFKGALIQDLMKAAGSSEKVYPYYIAGYENKLSGGYVETNDSSIDYLVHLATTAENNNIDSFYHGNSESKILEDLGTKNLVKYFTEPNGSGNFREFYNNAPLVAMVKFSWNGSSFDSIGDLATGANLSRTQTGDYLVTFNDRYKSDNYHVDVSLDTNASGHMGSFTVFSHGPTNLRLKTFAQDGSISSAIDPRNVWVKVTQIQV